MKGYWYTKVFIVLCFGNENKKNKLFKIISLLEIYVLKLLIFICDCGTL